MFVLIQQDLQAVVQSGEGYRIEFKRSVNTDLSKEMVAFANSSGGRIFIGIEDDGTMTGVAVTNELKSRVQAMAGDCDPSVPVDLEIVGNVLVVHVVEGKNKPYRCTNGFYVRNGPNSVKLSTEEIGEFFKEQGKIHFDEMRFRQVKYPTDLDENAIKKFVMLLSSPSPILTDHLLTNLGVVYQEDTVRIVNNAGVLFFAQNPTRLIPQSSVTCVVYQGNNKVDIIDKKTFDFHLIDNIDESLSFLKRHLNVAYEIKSKQRTEKLEIPEVALREAVVNAIAHRDYFEKGATVMIEIFDNRVEISNPGGLPKGLNPKDFGKRTLARNPLIASLLHRVGYIEKLGTGIQRIKQAMELANLPEPDFNWDGFFAVTFKRKKSTSSFIDGLAVSTKRGERIRLILPKLFAGELDIALLGEELKILPRNIRRDLEVLEKAGLLTSSGQTSNRAYQLTERGKSLAKEWSEWI
ncbi:MAG: ATP-binding protein [Cyclobacteriaceae bacterium]